MYSSWRLGISQYDSVGGVPISHHQKLSALLMWEVD
jgi:hypothetical protein